MIFSSPLRIALLTYSTNPRGGVVHTLELADSLTALGHHVTVFALDATGKGLFRDTACNTCLIPVEAAARDVAMMVEHRINDYLTYLRGIDLDEFDIWHAQDGISGNALATLRDEGRIPAFFRTVHHVDHFIDVRLAALQHRSIEAPDYLLTVSELWRSFLQHAISRDATVIGNGVNRDFYSPTPGAVDVSLRGRLGLRADAPVFLAIGGVEERKNTLRILEAFQLLHESEPAAQLVIAGGASLLDHSAYRTLFAEALAASGLPVSAVIRTGPLQQEVMPALFRAATALVFPSVKEGFGLVVLEAMASGTPAIVSQIAPFTEYLGKDDVAWCEPDEPVSIAAAMRATMHPQRSDQLRRRGLERAATFDWSHVARAHLDQYALAESCNA